jgi:hypothetical protein
MHGIVAQKQQKTHSLWVHTTIQMDMVVTLENISILIFE